MAAKKNNKNVSQAQAPRRPTRVTLKHVGANAGVSIGTVSDIVNRGLSRNYSSDTQARVQAAIRQLGYRPVRAAQHLRRGCSNTVGVILTRGFDNPYYARLFNEIKLSLERHGLSAELMVLNVRQKGAVRKSSDWMISQGVDGLIVGPVYYWDQPVLQELRDLKRMGMPIVTFGAVGGEAGMHNILLHDEEGGCLAIEYLVGQGHRRIALLGAYPPSDAQFGRGTIQEGIERALESHGLLDEAWLEVCPDSGSYEQCFKDAAAFAQRWLAANPAGRPTALICKTDQIAITALAAFHQHGLAIPEQLSIIGYDNVPESAYTIPALTTVDNAMTDRICAVANDIAQILKMPQISPGASEKIAPRMVERMSVRPLAAGS